MYLILSHFGELASKKSLIAMREYVDYNLGKNHAFSLDTTVSVRKNLRGSKISLIEISLKISHELNACNFLLISLRKVTFVIYQRKCY